MPNFDSTEAPVSVTVDDPEAYSGHMDDKPLKVAVDSSAENAELSHVPEGTAPDVRVSMSPGEAYHLVDDLNAAADACWGAAEYVVTAHTDDEQAYIGTIKAPTPADAVRRTVNLLEARLEDELDDAVIRRLNAADEADRFTAYRADSGSLVTPDELNDDEENEH